MARRLALGVFLIAGASAVLLLADLDHRQGRLEPDEGKARRWRLAFIEYNNTIDVEDSERGVLDGLRDAGLMPGRDFEYTVRNAQGDMATVSGLIDAALVEGSDLLVTFSTPTLQAAIQRARRTPVVFTYVANAVAAGAGTSDTDHLPNVTGVYMLSAVEPMLDMIREIMPAARVLGTVYVPAEVNMVHQRDALMKAASTRGFEIKSMAANSAAEVAEAALALSTSRIDAICQIPGNLSVTAFPSIVQAARRARMPVFVFQTAQLHGGAVLAVSRDYHGAGAEAGRLAARVIRGESTASLPLVEYAPTRLIVNLEAARQIGFSMPSAVVERAAEVVGR